MILLATLPPPVFDLSREGLTSRLTGAFDLTFVGGDAVDAARNLLLFAGWGAVWAATAIRPANWAGRARVILAATVVGSALSISVESIQLLSPHRTTHIWDFLTNTAGSAAGAGTLLVLIHGVELNRGERSYLGLPAFVLALGYGTAVLLEAFIPLLWQEAVPGSGGGILVRAGRALEHFSWRTLGELPLHHLILFPPAGAFAVAALAERGMERKQAFRWVAGATLPIFALAELLGGIAGQALSAGAVVLHAAAVTLGAWAAARWLPALTRRFRGRQRPLLFLATYLALLIIWSWRPFSLVSSLAALGEGLTLLQFRPLLAHGVRFDLFSVVDIARQSALLMPVGALLAVWPLRRRGPLRGPFPGIYVAVLLEGGQILVAGRLFDMTDVLVGAAAVTLGWVVIRRAGMAPWGEVLRS